MSKILALNDPTIKKLYFLKLFLAFQSLEPNIPKGTLMKQKMTATVVYGSGISKSLYRKLSSIESCLP